MTSMSDAPPMSESRLPSHVADEVIEVLFGRTDVETSLSVMFGVNQFDSESTQEIVEVLQTEVSLLQTQIAHSASPDRETLRITRRYMTAVAFLNDLMSQGSSSVGFPPKGRGVRSHVAAITRAGVASSVRSLSADVFDSEGSVRVRPRDMPPESIQPQRHLPRPKTLPLNEDILAPQSNQAQTQSPTGKFISDSSSSKVASSSSSSAGAAHSLSAHSLPSARSSDQDEEYKKQLLFAKKLSLTSGNKPVLGAGVGLSSSASSSSKRSDAGAGPELAEKLKIAKLRSEQLELEQRRLKSKIEVAELELQLARSQHSNPSTPRLAPPVIVPVTPPPKTNSPLADPHSPTSDEAILEATRSQVAELEARVQANKQRAEFPAETKVSSELAAVRLELEMLKKNLLNAADSPAVATTTAVAQIPDKISLPAGMPSKDPSKYRTWRGSLECSVCTASGDALACAQFLAEVKSDADPLLLASVCPKRFQHVDALLASSLQHILSGDVGDRISLEIRKSPEIRFSGRALLWHYDREFHYLSRTAVTIAASQFQNLTLAQNSWVGLQSFLTKLEGLLLTLDGTPDAPTTTALLNLFQDQVEQQCKFVDADLAAWRISPSPCPKALIKLLKDRCEVQRAKELRKDPTIRAVAASPLALASGLSSAATALIGGSLRRSFAR